VTSTATKHTNKSFLSWLRGFFPYFSLWVEGCLWVGWVVSFGGFDCCFLFVVGGVRNKFGSTLLTLLVLEAILLLTLALVTGVIPVVVVVLVGGVKLLPLGAVGDEVGDVAALEVAPRRPPPLLAESVQRAELPRQQDDLVIGDALVLLI
jgi:hypothetical protein